MKLLGCRVVSRAVVGRVVVSSRPAGRRGRAGLRMAAVAVGGA
jgi:hypothetical protein